MAVKSQLDGNLLVPVIRVVKCPVLVMMVGAVGAIRKKGDWVGHGVKNSMGVLGVEEGKM